MTASDGFDKQAFKDFEHVGWDRMAEGYNRIFALLSVQAIRGLLKSGAVETGLKVLDVACGPGLVAGAAHKAGATVTGLDLAENMLELAREHNPGPQYRSGDAENLPFEDDSFDAVLSNLGLYHFPDPDRALAEAFRVLKSGGRIAFTDWCPPKANPGFRMVIEAIQAQGTMDVPLPPGPPPFRFGEPEEAKRSARGAGFADPKTEKIPLTGNWSKEEEILGLVSDGTVRMGSLLRAQTPENLKNIDAAMRIAALVYKTEGEYRIPYPVLMCSARKP